jgi:hypothetical protein
MDGQESLQDKFGKLYDKITSLPKRLADAVEEGLKEGLGQPSNLVCVQEGVLDFERIDEDARRIQEDMKARGDRVLGSHLILDDKQDFMEIRTYIERNDEIFVIPVKAEVKRVTNIPSDVLTELQQQGRVELSLKLYQAVVAAAKEDKPKEQKKVTQSHLMDATSQIIEANKAASKPEFVLKPVEGEVQLPPVSNA